MENKIEVYRAISTVAAMINAEGGIAKEQVNTGQKFKFRGIDDILNSLAPKLAECQLIIIPKFVSRETQVRGTNNWAFTTVVMEYTFVSAIDGSSHTTTIIGEGSDGGDKSTGKAISNAFKLMCIQIFCIATEGGSSHDGDFSAPPAQNFNEVLWSAIQELRRCTTVEMLALVKARYSNEIIAHDQFKAEGLEKYNQLTQTS